MVWQKGQSGNIAGKPKGAVSFTTKIRHALDAIWTDKDGEKTTAERALIRSILEKAISGGDATMMRTIWEQLDGKPLQRLANADGSNLLNTDINYEQAIDIIRNRKAGGSGDSKK